MKSLFIFLISFLIINCGYGLVIDHNDIDLVDSYPQSLMNAIGQQRWLFTHASVGGNMMNGMVSLNSSDSSHFQLTRNSVGATGSGTSQRVNDPPTSTIPGTIYDCSRGNPGWLNKFCCFSNSVYFIK